MLSRCFLDCSVGLGVFVTGLSQISSFSLKSYISYGINSGVLQTKLIKLNIIYEIRCPF